MNFDYDSLAVLSAVVREGSFDGAAKALEVTQSAVSQRIRQLEDRVGTMLVVRGRPCVATETGQQLCQHFDEVRLLQHELSGRIAQESGQPSMAATVRIAVNADSLATWFPVILKRASEELNLRFEVILDDQDHTEQALKSGDALAVVTANARPIAGCRRVSLGAMDYLAVATPAFIRKHLPDGPKLNDLKRATCLFFDRKDTLPEQWLDLCFGQSERPPSHLVPSYEGYNECILSNIGWGMMPLETAGPYLETGKLIELVPGRRIRISLHWQSAAQTSEILRMLAELVEAEAKDLLLPDVYRDNQT